LIAAHIPRGSVDSKLKATLRMFREDPKADMEQRTPAAVLARSSTTSCKTNPAPGCAIHPADAEEYNTPDGESSSVAPSGDHGEPD